MYNVHLPVLILFKCIDEWIAMASAKRELERL